MIRNRNTTERRILDAVGQIVEAEGFEAVGVNAVAAKSGLSKVLIYRYFGSVESLLAKYMEVNDFWLNTDYSQLPHDDVKAFSKAIIRAYVGMLRNAPALRKLYRWELSAKNAAIDNLRHRREEMAMVIIDSICRLSGQPRDRVAVISTLITATVPYLCILGENCGVYNSLAIDTEDGWTKILETIDYMFDKLFE